MKSKSSRCKLCRADIKKGKEAYYAGNKICQKCFNRLKNPIPEKVRNSWMTKLIEELSLRK